MKAYSHKNALRIIGMLLAIFFLTKCGKEEELPSIDVRPDFKPFLDQYIAEAESRGVVADFSQTGLSIQFRPMEEEESAGVCFLGQFRIEIDRSDWNGMAPPEKEGLIFHELGHCHLDRPHLNNLLPNDEWKSRMRGTPFTDDRPTTVNFTGRRREYYVDELFDVNTPVPNWVNITQEYSFLDNVERNVIYERLPDSVSFMQRLFLPSGANWEIELEMNNYETEELIAIVWGQDNNEKSWRMGYSREKQFIIRSGEDIWGTIFIEDEVEELVNDEYNKLTVRQIDNVCYVFINEKFIYWFDYNGQVIGTFQSLERGSVNHFRNIFVSELLL